MGEWQQQFLSLISLHSVIGDLCIKVPIAHHHQYLRYENTQDRPNEHSIVCISVEWAQMVAMTTLNKSPFRSCFSLDDNRTYIVTCYIYKKGEIGVVSSTTTRLVNLFLHKVSVTQLLMLVCSLLHLLVIFSSYNAFI